MFCNQFKLMSLIVIVVALALGLSACAPMDLYAAFGNGDDAYSNTVSQYNTGVVSYYGYIAGGGDINFIPAYGTENCAALCQGNAYCGGWTTNIQGDCWLKQIGYNRVGWGYGWKYNILR